MAFDKPLEEITEADLKALIEAGTSEHKTLEYKLALPGGNDEARKEFLADISSFANSSGGHLIFGMREDAGTPVELLGIDGEGDEAILRLENIIRDGIAPRIAGVHSKAVKLATGQMAIVIHVPKSFASPHMVTYRSTSRFFARTSNGKSPLDVHQIRAAFFASETTAERIRNFRLERIGRIRARETAVPLRPGPCTALHILPIGAFGSGAKHYDVIGLKAKVPLVQQFAPLFFDFAHFVRVNFDGLLVYERDQDKKPTGFCQLYRSGIIETAEATLISAGERNGKGKEFSSLMFEVGLVKSARRLLTVLRLLDVDLPLLMMVSLVHARGYSMGTQNDFGQFATEEPFDRDLLAPQEILIESYDADVPMVLKPLIDEVWNAAGFDGSENYREGEWIPERR